MALELPNIVDIIEVMENYVEDIRPEENIRDQLDISYKIDNQSVILFEIRPSYKTPSEKMECCYAKATYVKTARRWKVFWMRASGKWQGYEPMPEVADLHEFISLVEEDKYHCFKG